jgi:hypothetical protein
MISQQGDGSPVNSQRALSYFELAVLLGHRGHVVPAEHDDVVERIAWVTTLAHAAKAELAEVETRLKAIQQKVEAVDEGQQEEVDGDERDDG